MSNNKNYLMKTEKKLKLSSYFIKLLMSFSLLIAFSLVLFYFHSMFYPEKYSNLLVNETSRSLEYKFNAEKVPETFKEWQESTKLFYYIKLDSYSQFRVVWTKIISFATFFLILFLFDRFIKSTRNFEYFFEKNIKILNQIIKLLLLLFIFNIIVLGFSNSMTITFEDAGRPHHITSAKINLELFSYYPLTIIFFFVLKEIFKRGKELKQENDLTI